MVGSKDRLSGGDGNDELHGGSSADKLYGGAGNDKLYGDSSNDYLKGHAGEDTLYGGTGKDYLRGEMIMTNFMENPVPTDFMEKMGMMNYTVVLVR